ncbi:hypothetical protein ACWDEM_32870, partial [Streptomyces sp. NPDC001054]
PPAGTTGPETTGPTETTGAARVDRRYASRAVRRTPSGALVSVLVPLVAGYSFILLRGPLLQATGRVAIAAVCVAVISTRSRDGRAWMK